MTDTLLCIIVWIGTHTHAHARTHPPTHTHTHRYMVIKKTSGSISIIGKSYLVSKIKFVSLPHWLPTKAKQRCIPCHLPIAVEGVGLYLSWTHFSHLSSQMYVMLATVVEGDQKAPFSIATTLRCRGGRYSFPWIALLYPWYVPYITEC